MAPMSVGNVFIKLTDPETAVAVRLSNYGDTEVSNISYTFYNVETQQSEGPFTINFDTPIAIGETRQVGIIMKPGSKLGKEDIIFNIT